MNFNSQVVLLILSWPLYSVCLCTATQDLLSVMSLSDRSHWFTALLLPSSLSPLCPRRQFFWCCDFFIIGIYLGTVTMVQSVLVPLGRTSAVALQLLTALGQQRFPLPALGTRVACKEQLVTYCLWNSVSIKLLELKRQTWRRKHFFLLWQINSRSCFQLCNALDALSNENFLISVAG